MLSELVVSLREFLLVHEPTLNPGDTARDIQRALARQSGSDRRIDLLRRLSARLVWNQHALEHGMAPPIGDATAEARECLTLMNGVGWRGPDGRRLDGCAESSSKVRFDRRQQI